MGVRKMDSVNELAEIIKDESDIIIYGCGAVGKKAWAWLKHNEISVQCFAVTDNSDLEQEIDGLTVKNIDDLAPSDDKLVIVATMEASHGAIGETLRKHGFQNIVYIANELYTEICRQVQLINPRLRFQIHVTEHCDLNCRGCYHFSPLAEEEYLDLRIYESDLERLSYLFDGEMEEILLLGGEPLYHPDMPRIIRLTRKYFHTGTIKILSNGLLLSKMPDDFWDACRETATELWLTKYPISMDYDALEGLARSHGNKIRYFNTEPVRTLGHQPLDIEGNQDYKKNFHSCYRKNTCVFLEKGKLYTCIIPGCVRHFNKYFNHDLEVSEADYIDIHKVESKEELMNGLLRPMPFCRYCDRSDVAVFGEIPWQQSKYQIEEWTK